MVGSDLPEDLRRLGGEILEVVDELDLQAEGALWLWMSSIDTWRFYVVTSLVDVMGRRETYRLIANAFDVTTRFAHLDAEDVRVVGPDEDPFCRFPKTNPGDDPHVHDLSIGGDVCGAYVYRMRPVDRERTQDVNRRVKDPIRIAWPRDAERELGPVPPRVGTAEHVQSRSISVTSDADSFHSSLGVFDEVDAIPREIREIMERNLDLVAV